MPVSLMELLAIPLSNQNTIAKWLVISPTLMEQLAIRIECKNTAAKSLVTSRHAGEGANERFASFKLTQALHRLVTRGPVHFGITGNALANHAQGVSADSH